MKARILVTSTDLMMIQFLIPHVQYLVENGYEVDVACSNVGGRIGEVCEKLNNTARSVKEVKVNRNPWNIHNVTGYYELKKMIESEKYDFIWTNEPVMSVLTRLASRKSRKSGTKVFYMVHGFHFYKDSPVLNWLLYYPIEYMMSGFCDAIVTINQEDYIRARKLKNKDTKYVHGIGVNTDRFPKNKRPKKTLRKKMGFDEDAILLLSVGELQPRKNHQVILKALSEVNDPKLHYLICGKGPLKAKLKKMAWKLGISHNVHFLGYRKDVIDICMQADIFALPSMREGLGIAGLEAMVCGLPLLTSDTSGPRDYMKHGKTGYIYHYDDVCGFAEGISLLKDNKILREEIGSYNQNAVNIYCIEAVKAEVLNLFEEEL